VGRGVLFTRTGRLCILFANSISLVFSRLVEPMSGIQSVIFRERVQNWVKEICCRVAHRNCMLVQTTTLKFKESYCVSSFTHRIQLLTRVRVR